MNNSLVVTFDSSLTELCEKNSSFDSAVMRIAYPGLNRNGSDISKAAFEKALPSIYNTPVVAHYIREDDALGGHDIEIVKNGDGDLEIVNLTTPVGVIPESANVWWETVEEDDGTEREYLHAEVLLWKRQEAYRKIKEDGITSQSMEINVKDGAVTDGVYYITDFEFTAFALIGVEPCFESASLEFSAKEFKAQLAEMMKDLRESYTLVTSSQEDADIHPHSTLTEGGNAKLDNEVENVVETEEPTEPATEPVIEPEAEPETGAGDPESAEPETAETEAAEPEASEDAEGEEADDEKGENFELTSNINEAIDEALYAVKYTDAWGDEWPRYCYVDSDVEKMEVYAFDHLDWHIYGFPFTMDGDRAVIDFENGVRKKWALVDFDEGESVDDDITNGMFARISSNLEKATNAFKEMADKTVELEASLNELAEFKKNVEDEQNRAAREGVFEQFPDLSGNEEFEALRDNCDGIDVEALTEKCYAIRGRAHTPAKFAFEPKAVKLKVDKSSKEDSVQDEPYGGIVEKYINK